MWLDSRYTKLQDEASLPQTLARCFPQQAACLGGAELPGAECVQGLSRDEGVLCGFGLGPSGIVGRPLQVILTRVAQGLKPLCAEADWDISMWRSGHHRV